MKQNIGHVDQSLRFLLGVILMFVGLLAMNGINGNLSGIVVALFASIPFYMSFTRSCFIFRWLNIHSLSWKELRELRRHQEAH